MNLSLSKMLASCGRAGGTNGNTCQIYIYVDMYFMFFCFNDGDVYKFMKFAEILKSWK